MTTEIIAIGLGLFVGLSLGALGGGGSTLAVPILVFIAGMEAKEATTASLVVVGLAAGIGVWRHHRNGNVRLGAGVAFGVAGIAGSRAGTLLNRSLDENLLLLAFSALVLFVAVRMFRSVGSGPVERTGSDEPDMPMGSSLLDPTGPGSTMVATKQRAGIDLSAPALAKLGAAATAVGLLTGLFGVGGGFAVVPALTLLLGFEAKEAIGTSLVVIAINAAIALSMRSGDLNVDWGLVLPFLATVTAGVAVGSRLADRVDADKLTRSFSMMLGLVAAYTGFSAVVLG